MAEISDLIMVFLTVRPNFVAIPSRRPLYTERYLESLNAQKKKERQNEHILTTKGPEETDENFKETTPRHGSCNSKVSDD